MVGPRAANAPARDPDPTRRVTVQALRDDDETAVREFCSTVWRLPGRMRSHSGIGPAQTP
jgi:hypothetical protein